MRRRVVARALLLWSERWAEEDDPYGEAYEKLKAAVAAWHVAALELSQERVMLVKTRAAHIFAALRVRTRSVRAWKHATRLLARRRAGSLVVAEGLIHW